MTYQVYILRCGDDSLYTGITNDLPARLAAHLSGKGAKYTRGRTPLTVVYTETCASRTAAQSREAAIKRLSRSDKLLLIQNQSDSQGTAN